MMVNVEQRGNCILNKDFTGSEKIDKYISLADRLMEAIPSLLDSQSRPVVSSTTQRPFLFYLGE